VLDGERRLRKYFKDVAEHEHDWVNLVERLHLLDPFGCKDLALTKCAGKPLAIQLNIPCPEPKVVANLTAIFPASLACLLLHRFLP